jgi:pimeloyl-ACP methyl ester carboxylesterase
MAVFVLVHGAWGGGVRYAPIAERLRAAGHEVHVVALTGLGDRIGELSPAITLSTHIDDTVAAIDATGSDRVILAGHSYGGMVVTGAAAKRAARIASLVYIDAFLPSDGEALWDIATEPERKHYIDAQRDSPGLVAPFPGVAAPDVRHPLLTLTEPFRASGDEHLIGRRTYILAERGMPVTFGKFHERAVADPGWQAFTLDTSHDVMADDPEGLLAILEGEATAIP